MEYFQALAEPAALMPNEGLKELPLEWIPVSREQMKLLKDAIAAFGNGEPPVHPYPLNPVNGTAAPKTAPARKAAEAAPAPKPPPSPAVASAQAKDPEWFFDIFCPIPHKGEKKADYDRNPETIGELYQSAKAGNDDDRKRLFGFARNWKPAAREFQGKTYQPTEADLVFRDALDAFMVWEEKHGKDTDPEERQNTTAGQAGEPEKDPFGDDDLPM